MASDKSRPEGDGEAGSGDERDDAGSLDDLPRFPLRGLQWHERNLEKGLTKAERQLARHNDPAERVTALLGMADAQDRLGRLQAALGRPLVVGDQRDERFHFGALEAARELRGAALETAREAPGDQPVLFAKVYGALTLDHARAGEWDRARSRLMDADTKYTLAIATGALDSHRDRVDLWRQCAELYLDQGLLDAARDTSRTIREGEQEKGRLSPIDQVRLQRVEALANLRSPDSNTGQRIVWEGRLSETAVRCRDNGLPAEAAANMLLLGEYYLEPPRQAPHDPVQYRDYCRRAALECFDSAASDARAAGNGRLWGLARWNYAATGLTEWGPGGPPPEAMQALGHNAKWQDHLNGAFGLLDGSGSPEVRLLADTRDDPIRPPLPLNGLLGPA